MKILKITFENLNSYEGKVEIDFTDPELKKGNNQFVISGPMGAGKSTILDAITLALYGRTARLGSLTDKEDGMELINKHSGYCRSEVIYSCAKGKYKSIFYMHKANKRNDGNVQQAQCSLTDITDGEPGEDKLVKAAISNLEEKNTEIIGLNYDQFVSCILIPQGKFDVFLNSDSRKKARILAKLSNTEHYRRAGEILKDEARECNEKYAKLETARDAIPVLDKEEREADEKELKALRDIAEKRDEEQKILANKITLLEQYQGISKSFIDAEGKKKAILSQTDEYKKKEEELKKARGSADCNVEYSRLKDCLRKQKEVSDFKGKAEADLAEVLKTQKPAEEKAGKLRESVEKKKADEEELKVLWNKVRGLDVKISGARSAEIEKKEANKKTEEELSKKTEEYKKYESQLQTGHAANEKVKAYLDDHKADEGLAESLASFGEKKAAWIQAENNRKAAVNEEAAKKQAAEQLHEDQVRLKEEETAISGELFALVSSKYLLVSEILRKDLKPGKPCPVCGREFKSDEEAASHKDDQANLTDEQQQAATDISNLNDRLVAKQNEINEIGNKIERTVSAAENAANLARTEEGNKKIILAEMNSLLKPWSIELDDTASEEELMTRQTELGELKDAYQSIKNAYEENEKKCSEANAYMKGIDLDKLKEACTAAGEAYENAKKELDGLLQQRAELFGEESVDEAEKAFGKELREMENSAAEAEKKFQEINNEITKKITAIEGYQKQEKDLVEEQGNYEKAFNSKLQKNGFVSEEEFLSYLKEEDDLKKLDEDIKGFESRKTAADTAYGIAQKALEEHKAKMQDAGLKTEKLEDLITQKTKLDDVIKDNIEKTGSLSQKLKQDTENRKAWNDADKKLEEEAKVTEIYNRISNLIGVSNGSDFEVFVQGIAMNSLLSEADNYLQGIVPQYHLEQKEQNSIDFHIIETMPDLTKIKREITNFSGGEKFVISLSLALAMSEFAGKGGDVECIFLDEGFGTLSGEALDEAIVALKKLGKTGKMLGIITHIDRVIQAFNRIEARKTGERSILEGPGVTYTNK